MKPNINDILRALTWVKHLAEGEMIETRQASREFLQLPQCPTLYIELAVNETLRLTSHPYRVRLNKDATKLLPIKL